MPVLVYRPNFGPIETTLKNGPTGNLPLPVNRSEIQTKKSTERCGIKFFICQYIISWGFQIRESRNLYVVPKKKPPWVLFDEFTVVILVGHVLLI